ncbi:MAG: hypothetical protein ACW97P_08945 [Candidatus Hodarchaeales archaeon]|jgi:uncharacterized membrane protein
MAQFSKKQGFLLFTALLMINLVLIDGLAFGVQLEPVTDPINCVIVRYSVCPLCVAKYRDNIKPFYDEYHYNESINFTIIDLHPDIGTALEELENFNITFSDVSIPPTVIFLWGDNQKQVLDGNNLGLIYDSFQSILEDIGYQPEPKNNSLPPPVDIINLEMLFFAIIIVLYFISVTFGGGILILTRYNFRLYLERISKSRFLLITSLSILSLITLLYQFFDYVEGGCGCMASNITKTLLFRQHETWDIFGMNIPFSLLGLIIVSLILIQIVVLSVMRFPLNISISKTKNFIISSKQGEIIYYFVMFQLFALIGALFYLLYLELFVIEYICILCTVSQLIIVAITVLVGTWSPFPTKDKQKNEIIT